MRLLLHACCGPCLIEPLDALRGGHEVTVVYANPNIRPGDEYARRLATLRSYAADARVQVIEEPYDPQVWRATVARLENDQPARCRACYRLRLEMTARVAASGGFDAFATTLTVSPYQDAEGIRIAGEAAGADFRVSYLHRDFRARYAQGVRRARELGLYRQSYCGCLPSKEEAEADRLRRRARRRTHATTAAARTETPEP